MEIRWDGDSGALGEAGSGGGGGGKEVGWGSEPCVFAVEPPFL